MPLAIASWPSKIPAQYSPSSSGPTSSDLPSELPSDLPPNLPSELPSELPPAPLGCGGAGDLPGGHTSGQLSSDEIAPVISRWLSPLPNSRAAHPQPSRCARPDAVAVSPRAATHL